METSERMTLLSSQLKPNFWMLMRERHLLQKTPRNRAVKQPKRHFQHQIDIKRLSLNFCLTFSLLKSKYSRDSRQVGELNDQVVSNLNFFE